MRFSGKLFSLDCLATCENQREDFSLNTNRNRVNPYNVLRVGLHDYHLNIVPPINPDWFADAIIALFGCRCFRS